MAITEYYVSAAGGGAHDGTSEADAWTLSEAITANNALGAGGAAGRRYNVKGANTGRGASDTISVGGTTTSPAIWRGYGTVIGDATVARSSGGALDTTNMPDIGYNTGYRFSTTGSYIIVESIDFSGAYAGGQLNLGGAENQAVNCNVVNTSSNSGAGGIGLNANRASAINCDVLVSHASATSGVGIDTSGGSYGAAIGCRVKCVAAKGIIVSGGLVANCTIYECGGSGVQIQSNTTTSVVLNNTIYGCTGDGINFTNTMTGTQRIIGNHITDNGGYGINVNGATCEVFAANNRTRDNTSGATSGAADWFTGTSIRHVTTDTGGASTDYTDTTTDDYSLIAAAPGISGNVGYLCDIGACGTPVVSGGGGGGPLIGGRLVQ